MGSPPFFLFSVLRCPFFRSVLTLRHLRSRPIPYSFYVFLVPSRLHILLAFLPSPGWRGVRCQPDFSSTLIIHSQLQVRVRSTWTENMSSKWETSLTLSFLFLLFLITFGLPLHIALTQKIKLVCWPSKFGEAGFSASRSYPLNAASMLFSSSIGALVVPLCNSIALIT